MNLNEPASYDEIRAGVRKVCSRFPGEYWRSLEPNTYPTDFVKALSDHGWLGVLIPEEFGGGGATLAEASVILEEICASGANAAACHAQMYVMGTLLRHGSEEQKRRYLPAIAKGDLRLQAFGVTEPDAGSETWRITTKAERVEGGYRINGRKVFISRAAHSDLMILLARTTPFELVERRTEGLSVFIVDLRDAGNAITIRPIRTMMNHSTTELFIDDLFVPSAALIGEENNGFSHILDGMNAERILIAAECIGDGRYFLERASAHASSRVVFGKPIGANQGVQFPLARAYAAVHAASLVRYEAASLFDQDQPCGVEANMAKLLASEASWSAANACLDTFGGSGFAVDNDVERKFRETRLFQVAPIANNLVLAYLAHQALNLPRSY
jgi:acyl-CoA dehydrogenase